MKKVFKVIKWIAIVICALLVVFFLVRAIGMAVNNRTPDGGINESMYIDVNGTKQWIDIYGEDKDNPVLLYLPSVICMVALAQQQATSITLSQESGLMFILWLPGTNAIVGKAMILNKTTLS